MQALMFDTEAIKEQCPRTRLEYLAELPSTNDHALNLARSGMDQPTLVLCDTQTAGRGRRSNRWASSEGSMTISWCFKLNQSVAYASSAMSAVVGCVVAKAIESVRPEVSLQLKWPNDILAIDGPGKVGKLAGVLIESVSSNGQIVVIGIGINVNNRLPSDFSSNEIPPTSLQKLTGSETDRTKLVIQVVRGLEKALLDGDGVIGWKEAYQNRMAYRDQAVVILDASGEVLKKGILRSIAEDGRLLLENKGKLNSVYRGTLRPA